jgi:hypothetical protein
MKSEIRKIVREVITEMEMAIGGTGWDSNNDVSRFYASPSGYGQFPYLYTDIPEMLPDKDEVNRRNEKGFNDFSNNHEVYEFPIEDFQKGLEIEKERASHLNSFSSIFDIANIVINNLKQDKNYYQDENAGNT